MPTSNLNIALEVINLVEQIPEHRMILDVGPGYGKYGLLLREYLNIKPEQVWGCEAEPSYVKNFARWHGGIYDHVIEADATTLEEGVLDQFDFVLMVDVIEHMPKPAALALLGRIRGRVVVATPRDFFTQHVDGVPWEDHVSHWTVEEFRAMPRCEVAYVNEIGALIVRLGPRP